MSTYQIAYAAENIAKSIKAIATSIEKIAEKKTTNYTIIVNTLGDEDDVATKVQEAMKRAEKRGGN